MSPDDFAHVGANDEQSLDEMKEIRWFRACRSQWLGLKPI